MGASNFAFLSALLVDSSANHRPPKNFYYEVLHSGEAMWASGRTLCITGSYAARTQRLRLGFRRRPQPRRASVDRFIDRFLF